MAKEHSAFLIFLRKGRSIMKRRLIAVVRVLILAVALLFVFELSAEALLPGIDSNLTADLFQRSLKGFNIANLIIILLAVAAGCVIAAHRWNEDGFWSYLGQFVIIFLFVAIGQFLMIGLGACLHGVLQQLAGWFVGADKAVVDAAIQSTMSGINWIDEMTKIIMGWFSYPQWFFAILIATPMAAVLTAKGPAILAFGSDNNG